MNKKTNKSFKQMESENKRAENKSSQKSEKKPKKDIEFGKILLSNLGKKTITLEAKNFQQSFLFIEQPSWYKDKNKDNKSQAVYTSSIMIHKKDSASIKELEKHIKACVQASNEIEESNKKKVIEQTLNFGEDYSILKDGEKMFSKNPDKYENLKDFWLLKVTMQAEIIDSEKEIFKPKFPLKLVKDKENVTENISENFYSGMFASVIFNLACYPKNSLVRTGGIKAYLSAIKYESEGERYSNSQANFSD